MPAGLIVSKKISQGEEWVNTYAVITNGADTVPLQPEDIAQITGGNIPISDATTDPNNPSYQGQNSFVHAVLGFERLIHRAPVNFIQLYVTDGRGPAAGPGNTFAVFDYSFSGLRTGATENIAPGTVTLMVSRQPLGFGQRRGRAFFRGVLADNEVGFGSRRLVDFTDDTTRDTYVGLVFNAQVDSGLENFIGTGSDVANNRLAIPNYNTLTDALVGATPIAQLVVAGVFSRQVKAGRKRNTT